MQPRGRIKQIFITLLALLAACLLAAPVVAADNDNVIELGCAISFTGGKSRTGKLYIDAYKFAVQQVNETGGIKMGDQTYKLKLKFYDDQSEATESSRLVEKLISQDKVNFLLGPYSSGITIPNSLVARRYRVPMIEGGGASSKIFNKGNRYIFGTLPRAEGYFKSTLEYLKKEAKPQPQKVAILYADDKFDVSVGHGAQKTAESLGFDVVIFEKYAQGASDFTSVLTKIKSKGANAVLVAGHTEEALNFVQQAKELDVTPNFLSLTVGPTEADFVKALGEDAEYIYGVASWSPEMNFDGYLWQDTQTFVEEFKKKFDYNPDYHTASAVADIAIYKDAIERAGTLDREKVRDAIASTDLSTVYGQVSFYPGGQIKGTSVVMQVLNGEASQVYPGGKDPVYPIPPWNER